MFRWSVTQGEGRPASQLERLTSPASQMLAIALQGAQKPSQLGEVRVADMQIMSSQEVAFTDAL